MTVPYAEEIKALKSPHNATTYIISFLSFSKWNHKIFELKKIIALVFLLAKLFYMKYFWTDLTDMEVNTLLGLRNP